MNTLSRRKCRAMRQRPLSGSCTAALRVPSAGEAVRLVELGTHCHGAIFLDDDDRRFFLATLSEACAMTAWRVHAWVLMGNHFD